jgi:acetolactate synthase-1/2/3 large subunit
MAEPAADAAWSSRSRVVDYLVGYLAATGVEFVFGVDGANIEDFYDAANYCANLTALLAKHEFSAVAMADGYSRGHAGLGVVVATSGGGALNLVPGLGEALTSRIPMLVLVGQPPMILDGQGSFQDMSGRNHSLNAKALFSTVALYCRRITRPGEIVGVLPEALDAATRGGPAVLLLPKDVQQAPLDPRGRTVVEDRPRRTQVAPAHGAPEDLDAIVDLLRAANGPVTIIAGEQVARDDARPELEQLRQVLDASVATVPEAKDVSGSPGLGPSSLLGVTGVMGHRQVAEAIRRSSAVLLLGTRLPATARTGLDDALAEVPTVSMGSAAPYVSCSHVYSEDLRSSLTQLSGALTRPPALPIQPLGPSGNVDEAITPPAATGAGIRYPEAMAVLDALLPDGVDIAVDAGNCGASAIHLLPVRRDGRFVVALGMGGMGYSFGAGIGLALGRRRRSVVIAGDGAFFMHGLEIHTAVEYRLPVTFVLFNNNAHAMCAVRERLYFDNTHSYNRFRLSRLGAGLAAMFPGLQSTDVCDVKELTAALDAALKNEGPSVISIECSPDEIPPFTPFLAHSVARAADRYTTSP